MDNKFSIDRIREAQKSFFPDGGRRAVHEVRHRSWFRKFVDRLREDRLVLFGFVMILILATLLTAALVAPVATRNVVFSFLPHGAVRLLTGDSGYGMDFRALEEKYGQLTEDEKRQLRDFINTH